MYDRAQTRGKTPHSGQVEHFNFHYIGSNVICLVQPSQAILTVISIPTSGVGSLAERRFKFTESLRKVR